MASQSPPSTPLSPLLPSFRPLFPPSPDLTQQSKPDAHEGTKSSKTTFLGAKDMVLTVGFTKQSQRQLKIWDTRNLNTEIKSLEIDQAAGVIMPFFDPDSNLLYLAGKVRVILRFHTHTYSVIQIHHTYTHIDTTSQL
jgi:coronin-1B/1C/6